MTYEISSAIDEPTNVADRTDEVLVRPKHPKASQVHQG